MAVKDRYFNVKPESDGSVTIEKLLEILQTIELRVTYDQDFEMICESTVKYLVEVYVPPTANELKSFRRDLTEVGEVLERIVRRSENYEHLILISLQTLYKLLASTSKPSAAAGVIFNIWGEALPEAIRLLMNNSTNIDFDEDIKKVIMILCHWLRMYSDFSDLNRCIIEMLNGLADLKKYDLLIAISNEVIESLFISLIIPCIRPNTMPLVVHILKSTQSATIFEKLVSRIPKVIPTVESSIRLMSVDEESRFDELIDVIFALMEKFPSWDSTYNDIERVLSKHRPKQPSHIVLGCKTWEPAIAPISLRDPKTPIGLVNLGSTCYMNSVLQALFLTQNFTREVLELRFPSRIIGLVQQLFALLLYSVRPELVPRNILDTRPPTFRNGQQQDSFEYLGYLLDQLHEEERKTVSSSSRLTSKTNYNINDDVNAARHVYDYDGYEWPSQTDSLKLIEPIPNTFPYPDDDEMNGIKLEETRSFLDEYLDRTTVDEDMEATKLELCDTIEKTPSPSPSLESKPQLDPLLLPPAPESVQSIEPAQTIVQRLFGGKMSVTYKCLECHSTSTNVDNFFDLQLSFPHANDHGTLNKSYHYYNTQSLLDSYFSTEQLIEDDKYRCDKCAKLCDGERNINLEIGPSHLILVIKHFKYDRKFHVRRKLLHKVHHNDIITLQTGEDANGECLRHTYKLYAAIVHSGMNIDSGHYYTFGKDQQDNWFKFNDNFVNRSSLSDIKDLSDLSTPYILFYNLVATEKSDANISTNADALANIVDNSTLAAASNAKMNEMPAAKFDWPDLCELSPLLQEFVRKDNLAYTNEYRRKNHDEQDIHRYNKHRKSDNDKDPPSSCGGNMIESSNRYIY